MGVYEVRTQYTPGMHWQHHPERHQMLAAAYDPSRDLSPNLPTTCQDGGGSLSSGASSSCLTSCSFKTEEGYDQLDSGYCRPDYHSVEPKQEPRPAVQTNEEERVCAGCGRRIADKYYLSAVERRWHTTCLRCCQCHQCFDGEITCFTKDGNIYCKKDYLRIFGMKRCGRCQATILATEMVMRARGLVFHIHCFTCVICHSVLTKGETFGMRDGAVFCRPHFEDLPPLPLDNRLPYPTDIPYHPHPRLGPHSTPPPNLPLPLPSTPPDQLKVPNNFFNGAPTPRQKGRPRKRKPKDLDSMTANLDLNAESYLDVAYGPGTPGMGGANGNHQRTKRMRTSFKHHQLRTMKSYFALNHNPDAKDLKQLSQKTGLPKRVLQVWFQNARAKWRRMMLKQESGSSKQGDKCVENSGSSMEAAYHLPHGSPHRYLSPSPMECSS